MISQRIHINNDINVVEFMALNYEVKEIGGEKIVIGKPITSPKLIKQFKRLGMRWTKRIGYECSFNTKGYEFIIAYLFIKTSPIVSEELPILLCKEISNFIDELDKIIKDNYVGEWEYYLDNPKSTILMEKKIGWNISLQELFDLYSFFMICYNSHLQILIYVD